MIQVTTSTRSLTTVATAMVKDVDVKALIAKFASETVWREADMSVTDLALTSPSASPFGLDLLYYEIQKDCKDEVPKKRNSRRKPSPRLSE